MLGNVTNRWTLTDFYTLYFGEIQRWVCILWYKKQMLFYKSTLLHFPVSSEQSKLKFAKSYFWNMK